ncbi:MAG: hydrogenase subunit MbhD domain-containing protein, partial [Gammaproteobacteria bacterium]|nr:hydrogenase subunit MbhD domain-containing protein [Gammaproteobacteria bacterium]
METLIWNLFDLLLLTALLALGWSALSTPSLRKGIALFIAFGLVLSLIWARLKAPDIALAEAAIGTGLTGALLLAALRDEESAPADSSPQEQRNNFSAYLLVMVTIILTLILGWGLTDAVMNSQYPGLANDVFAHLDQSGVSNPVTAVLLNFRAYDTFLELAVLLAAVLGIRSLNIARQPYLRAGPVLAGLTVWLVPVLIVISAYLLWVGAHAPGGAFQAGAVLAAAGVLLRLSGYPAAGLPANLLIRRALMIIGVLVFAMTGLGLMVFGGAFLEYPLPWAGSLILLIETAATLSIAVIL